MGSAFSKSLKYGICRKSEKFENIHPCCSVPSVIVWRPSVRQQPWHLHNYLELEGDRVSPKVGIKLGVDVDSRRLAGGVLDDQEQLGDYLNDVTSLEHKIPLPLDCFWWETARDIGLRSQFSCRGTLQKMNEISLQWYFSAKTFILDYHILNNWPWVIQWPSTWGIGVTIPISCSTF